MLHTNVEGTLFFECVVKNKLFMRKLQRKTSACCYNSFFQNEISDRKNTVSKLCQFPSFLK